MDRRSFGRRAVSQPAAPHAIPAMPAFRVAAVSVATLPPEPAAANTSSVDDELDEWKQQRRFKVPWSQVCLMASICFGIGSLVLPDDVNRAVNWLLYGLTAMSLYAWYTGRRARAKT